MRGIVLHVQLKATSKPKELRKVRSPTTGIYTWPGV